MQNSKKNSPILTDQGRKGKTFRDRDYFEDVCGDIYQVIGSLHIPGFVFALQKYKKVQGDGQDIEIISSKIRQSNPIEEIKPHKFRLWEKKGTTHRYYRILPNYSSISAQNNITENKYSQFCSIFQRKLIMVPNDKINYYWRPEERVKELTEWMNLPPADNRSIAEKLSKFDELERESIEVLSFLSDLFKIDLAEMGITGSLLWKGHHPQSDIDLMIYGHHNCRKILNSTQIQPRDAQKDGKGLRKYTKLEILPIAQKMSVKSGLPLEECFDYIYHKPYLFYYDNRKISLTFAPLYTEIPKCPLFIPETKFISLDVCCISAQIESDEWGFDYPGLFALREIKIIKCPSNFLQNAEQITRLLVYEHEFVGYYRKGERVEVKGMLQRVERAPNYNQPWEIIDIYQILIGGVETFGNEYVKKQEKKIDEKESEETD